MAGMLRHDSRMDTTTNTPTRPTETIDTIQRYARLALMLDEVAQEDVDYDVEIDANSSCVTWVTIRTVSASGWVHTYALWRIKYGNEHGSRTSAKFIGGGRTFMSHTKPLRSIDAATRSLIHTAKTTV